MLTQGFTTITNNSVNSEVELIKTREYENDYFSFNYSSDWKISDNEDMGDGVYYVSVEKKGLDDSGLVTIMSYNQMLDLDDLIQFDLDDLKNNESLKKFKNQEFKNSIYNKNDTRSSTYTFEVYGLKFKGIIHAFSSENNTVIIANQEAEEDSKKNASGFKVIEESFQLK